MEPVTIQNEIAYVNLSREFQNLRGSAATMAALGALRLSLTEITGITKVQVLIEGKKGADFDGRILEPMARGLYDYPVLVDADRTQYLQSQYDQGKEPWRDDPLKVAQWEGRMFGFTAGELQAAQVIQNGHTAKVQMPRSGGIYIISLQQNQVTERQGIWTIDALDPLVRHTLDGLPGSVRQWADHYVKTTVGVALHAQDRTYLMAAVEAGKVHIASAAAEGGELVVSITEQGSGSYAIASVTGAEAGLPVRFQWQSAPTGAASQYTAPDQLPSLQNPHKLPPADLTGSIAVLTPTPDQSVQGTIKISGYARHLFEAHLVARLFDQQGNEAAKTSTTTAACCFDWGSFDFELKQSVPAGSYVLELGAFSPKDGQWQASAKIPLRVTK